MELITRRDEKRNQSAVKTFLSNVRKEGKERVQK
jgi:hypothetical protein